MPTRRTFTTFTVTKRKIRVDSPLRYLLLDYFLVVSHEDKRLYVVARIYLLLVSFNNICDANIFFTCTIFILFDALLVK